MQVGGCKIVTGNVKYSVGDIVNHIVITMYVSGGRSLNTHAATPETKIILTVTVITFF